MNIRKATDEEVSLHSRGRHGLRVYDEIEQTLRRDRSIVIECTNELELRRFQKSMNAWGYSSKRPKVRTRRIAELSLLVTIRD